MGCPQRRPGEGPLFFSFIVGGEGGLCNRAVEDGPKHCFSAPGTRRTRLPVGRRIKQTKLLTGRALLLMLPVLVLLVVVLLMLLVVVLLLLLLLAKENS